MFQNEPVFIGLMWKNFILCSVIRKDGLNFVRLYFLNYTLYVNDLQNI